MDAPKKKRNLSRQLGVLEAHAGLRPNIAICSKIAKATPRPENISKTIESMRSEKFSRKLHQIEGLVNRVCKKNKAFVIRKLIRRIKSSENPQDLDDRLKKLKSINHSEVAKHILYNSMLKEFSNYLALLAFKLEDHQVPDCQENYDFINGNSLRTSIDEIKSDLKMFLSKLLHYESPHFQSRSRSQSSSIRSHGKHDNKNKNNKFQDRKERIEKRETTRRSTNSLQTDKYGDNDNDYGSFNNPSSGNSQFIFSLNNSLEGEGETKEPIMNTNHRNKYKNDSFNGIDIDNDISNYSHQDNLQTAKQRKSNNHSNQDSIINHRNKREGSHDQQIDQSLSIHSLHPSWEAAKQNKIRKFTGKKIKFNDE